MSGTRELLEKAFVEIRGLRAELAALKRAAREPIAVVGMGCRFPGGAASPEAFWEMLVAGTDAVREAPPERWDVAALVDPDPDAPARMIHARGAYLDDLTGFDAAFFDITPREAVGMDPLQRMLLEVSWEALEHAWIVPSSLRGSDTGVFMGSFLNDYGDTNLYSNDGTRIDAYVGQNAMRSLLAGRLAYYYDFHGPTMTLDTACSTSLLTLDLACRALRDRTCSLALAGGANAVLSPRLHIGLTKMRAMSPVGRCHSFDAAADGYVRGEGAGVLVLQRLEDARRSGRPVLAVVAGSAVNHNGRSNGLTAPNGEAQTALLRAALRAAGLQPADIGYLEAHGTGTALGDPIEVEAFSRALLADPRPEPLLVGSVKTNIGHLEAASGVAGVIKAVLALQHRYVPPHLHFRNPNPTISWDPARLRVAAEGTAWPEKAGRYAGVSAFGMSGVNAHVILGPAPEETLGADQNAPGGQDRPSVLCLSGRDAGALQAQAAAYAALLRAQPERAAAVCHGARVGREAHAYRLAAVGADGLTLADALDAQDVVRGHLSADTAPRIAFLFTGQGAQTARMGWALYAAEPAYRDAVARCAAVAAEAGIDLVGALASEGDDLHHTLLTQPALYALQVGLVDLWRAWGVTPDAVLGHSVGQFAAAYAAGMFSLEDGMRLVLARARLMAALPEGGAMLVVYADAARVREAATAGRTAGLLDIAAYNTPEQVVVSGTAEALADLARGLGDVRTRLLQVSHAFHSPAMDGILDAFEAVVAAVPMQAPVCRFVDNLAGRFLTHGAATPSYWRRCAREPVAFAMGMRTLHEAGFDLFLELGPKPVLSDLGRQTLGDGPVWATSLHPRLDDRTAMARACAHLFVAGRPPAAEAVGGLQQARPFALPTYPWQRRRFWQFRDTGLTAPAAAARVGALPGTLSRGVDGSAVCRTLLGAAGPAYVGDHRLYGVPVVSGAMFLAWVGAARRALEGDAAYRLEDVTFQQPLAFADATPRRCSVAMHADARFVIASAPDAAPEAVVDHVRGRIGAAPAPAAAAPDFGAMRARARLSLPGEAFYERYFNEAYGWGDSFRLLETAWRGVGETVARLRAPAAVDDLPFFPGLLDTTLLLTSTCLRRDGAPLFAREATLIPFHLASFTWYGGTPAWCTVSLDTVPEDAETPVSDILAHAALWREDGRLVAEVRGLAVREADAGVVHKALLDATARPGTCYVPVEVPLGAGDEAAAAVVRVITREGATGAALVEALRAAGAAVTVCAPDALDGAAGAPACDAWVFVGDPGMPERDAQIVAARNLLCSDLLAVARFVVHRGLRMPLYVVSPDHAAADALDGMAACLRLELPGPVVRVTHRQGAVDGLAGLVRARPRETRLVAAGDGVHALRLRAQTLTGRRGFVVRPDAVYLVTGGLGGLGLHVADWLADKGARRLVLCGRTPREDARLHALRERGVHVRVLGVDVGRREAVEDLMARVAEDGVPLAGVFHLAGSRADASVATLEPEMLIAAFAAKADAAAYLDAATRHLDLDAFVVFSSAASLLGSRGQAAYGAANAAMDGVVRRRRAAGLPALSVNWGLWEGEGMASGLDARQMARMAASGMGALAPAEALHLLDGLLGEQLTQAGAFAVDWPTYTAVTGTEAFTADLARGDTAPESREEAATPDLAAAYLQAPAYARRDILADGLAALVRGVLHLGAQDALPRDKSIFDLGMDSLMAMELKDVVARALRLNLSSSLLFDYPDLDALTEHLAERLTPPEVVAAPAAPAPVAADVSLSQPEDAAPDLSEEDAEALLLRELEDLNF